MIYFIHPSTLILFGLLLYGIYFILNKHLIYLPKNYKQRIIVFKF
jgi:hypothetical protein